MFAKLLRPIWPEARRGQQTRNGSDAPDIEGTEYWVECKVGKAPNIRKAVEQAQEATDGRPVLVLTKKDYCDSLVTMVFGDWLEEKKMNQALDELVDALEEEIASLKDQMGDLEEYVSVLEEQIGVGVA